MVDWPSYFGIFIDSQTTMRGQIFANVSPKTPLAGTKVQQFQFQCIVIWLKINKSKFMSGQKPQMVILQFVIPFLKNVKNVL
jgi:hypothetical protein